MAAHRERVCALQEHIEQVMVDRQHLLDRVGCPYEIRKISNAISNTQYVGAHHIRPELYHL